MYEISKVIVIVVVVLICFEIREKESGIYCDKLYSKKRWLGIKMMYRCFNFIGYKIVVEIKSIIYMFMWFVKSWLLIVERVVVNM